ncbi:MAG: hypothetical protein ACE5HY_00810 [Candidatus Hydrothermarchaeales archaeon]
MIFGAILAATSVVTLFLSLALLVLSIWKREKLTSETAWDMLMERTSHLKLVFILMFFSLIIYLIAESAELLNIESPSAVLLEVHEVGESIHMIIGVAALLAVIPLLLIMQGGEDVS